MGKTVRAITIDPEIDELIRIKTFEDKNFNASRLLNDYLKEYFKDSFVDLSKKKLMESRAIMEKKLAVIKSQLAASEKKEKAKLKELEEEKKKEATKEYDDLGIKKVKRGIIDGIY